MALDSFQNVFAGNPLDRVSDRRGDPAWLADRLAGPDTLVIAAWSGRLLVEDAPDGGVRIAYLPASLAVTLGGGAEKLLFVGLWKDTAVFAVDLDDPADPTAGPLEGMGRFEELRAVAMILPPPEAAILATVRAMFEWSRRHRYCAACGQPSEPQDGGWKRRCPACRAEHFPRTDPVVIMLAVHKDRCLMGRNVGWPATHFSALAGFLEPGESIEEGCARELYEEAGLRTTSVRYHSTQPWPYPSSLMIGLVAEVDSDQAAPDQTELEELRWFTRDEALAVLAGANPEVKAPGDVAIAKQLLRAWAEGEI